MNIRWERQTARWSNGEDGYLGERVVFSVVWDSMISKGDTKPYKLNCFLAGYKPVMGNYSNEDTAKERAEQVLEKWLNSAGLKIKDKSND